MRIDIYHDTACPWCRVGKRNLKLALAQAGETADLRYHTFFLNPDIPAEGYDFRQYMFAKGGGQVPLEQWFAAPRSAGERAGVVFNFEAITRAPNTLLSHRLIELAPEDQREAVIDALYDAYFQHGRDIGDVEVLLDIAGAHGMDNEQTRSALLDATAQARLLNEAQSASALGITGVPFFIINERYAFSGAQPPQTILQIFEQVKQLEAQGASN